MRTAKVELNVVKNKIFRINLWIYILSKIMKSKAIITKINVKIYNTHLDRIHNYFNNDQNKQNVYTFKYMI